MSDATESPKEKITRRRFVELGVGLTFVVMLDPWGCKPKPQPQQVGEPSRSAGEAPVGPWVRINTDDTIVIYNPAAEMGQGSMTALPLILAEEMDADWDKVRVEDSPVDPNVYGRSWSRGGPGTMMTVGSQAVIGYFTKLRIAGAQIRAVLLSSVATLWDVPVTELSTEPGVVVHAASGRRITYGEVAAQATVPVDLPEIDEAALKSRKDFRLIGTSVPRWDVPSKTDGSAMFAVDIDLPDMVHGVIARSPIHERRPRTYNAEEVRALPGVVTTVELDHGIGVLATSIEGALAARQKLEIDWEPDHPLESFDSEEALAGYPKIADDDDFKARSITEEGDAPKALAAAAKRYEADFFADYVYHAQMEPLNAVVSVDESGGAEVWLGTQAPGAARSAVAGALGVNEARVKMNRCYLGGGFGRRSSADYAVEAAHLSQAVRRPVKLIWTREDDLQYGMFRPMCLQRVRAGVDKDGNITAWTHCIVGDGGQLLGSGIEIPLYDIPNQQIELRLVNHGVRLHYWRAVGHGYNKYAIEALIDDVAIGEGIDPVELRRRLTKSSPRARAVIDAVAKMSGWGAPAIEGRAKGIALAERSGSIAAGVAEVSVDAPTGKLRVHRFWCAIDAGVIVQPDNSRAQIEGSIVMGLSSALTERVTLKRGRVQQSNFHDYRIMRMSEAPQIEVTFIDSVYHPSGIGEPGVPITAGAVANAFAALTGRRLRHMPFTPERVQTALS